MSAIGDATQQVYSELIAWGKRAAALALLVYIVLILAKLFGFNLLPGLVTDSAQETGVLLAGLAFALGKA